MFKRIVFVAVGLLMITGIVHALPSWTQVPLRTAAQEALGISGGEGTQNIFGISYAPSDSNILYLLSNTSQVWKSIDGGNSWQMKHNGFLANGGLPLVVHPNNPDIVFVAGSSFQSDTVTCSMDNGPRVPKCADGIYRTTNGGESWAMVKQTPFYNIGRKVGGVNFAFAGTDTIYAGTHTEGLLKSTDGGNSWSPLNILTGTKILNVKIHPQNSSIIFLSVDRSSLSEPVLYKVTDNGTVTLEPIGSNLNSLSCNAQEPVPVARAIAIKPNDPDIIYVSMGFCGVYKSTDGGITFVAKNNGLLTYKAATYLAMSPVNPDYLYVDFHEEGLRQPYYTHNGGDNWLQPSYIYNIWNPETSGGGSYAHGPIAPHPTDENIAITSVGGNYPEKTTNGGDTWAYSGNGYCGGRAGIGTTSFSWDLDPNNQNRFALFLIDYGPFLTDDGGSTFTRLGIPRYQCSTCQSSSETTPVGALHPTNPNVVVTAIGGWNTQALAIGERAPDQTWNWTLIGTTCNNNICTCIDPDDPNDPNDSYSCLEDNYKFIAFHPNPTNLPYPYTDIIYAGKYKIYYSNLDGSYTWFPLSKKVIAMFPGNGDIVYAAEMGGYLNMTLTISKSIDRGETWTQYPSVSIKTTSPGEIFIDTTNQDRIYVATNGYGTGPYGVYIYDGSVWVQKTDAHGLEKDRFGTVNTGRITVDPTEPNVVYAGRVVNIYGEANGIFGSTDYGNTWKNITYNLGPEFTTWAISVNPHNERVYIGSSLGTWYLEKASWYDGDNDGYPRATDCNDTDPLVNPGATEVPYNGKDDDCNPATKDDDLDGDGYLIATDCNDNDPSVNPGAIEISFNGKDDDCNEATSDTTPVDLYISSFIVPSPANPGQTIVVSDITNNSGPGNAGPSTIKFYFSTNNGWYDPEDTYLGSRSVPVIPAGASNSGVTSVTIPAGTPSGNYRFIAIADADNIVPESNERNNKKNKPIMIN